MVATKPMTLAEFAALPDDGWRYELERGELQRMPAGGVLHGGISLTVGSKLRDHVSLNRLGLAVVETGFIFADDPPTLKVPDVAFISTARLPPPAERPNFARVAPDLAVEVVSPGDTAVEVAAKAAFYLAHGVSLVWVIDPETRQVTSYRPNLDPVILRVGETVTGDPVVPGFVLPVADIFR